MVGVFIILQVMKTRSDPCAVNTKRTGLCSYINPIVEDHSIEWTREPAKREMGPHQGETHSTQTVNLLGLLKIKLKPIRYLASPSLSMTHL